MDLSREERITAVAIIMRDAVEEMLAHDATASESTSRATKETRTS